MKKSCITQYILYTATTTRILTFGHMRSCTILIINSRTPCGSIRYGATQGFVEKIGVSCLKAQMHHTVGAIYHVLLTYQYGIWTITFERHLVLKEHLGIAKKYQRHPTASNQHPPPRMRPKEAQHPAHPNCPLRNPKYHRIDPIRPLVEVHWGV